MSDALPATLGMLLALLGTLASPLPASPLPASPLPASPLPASPLPTSAATLASETDESGLDVRLSAAFYADTFCLLTIDRHATMGRTLIDASVGDGTSRTLVHCDTEDGRRLTLLARGVTLERRTRMALLPRASIERGQDGVIAWLTRAGKSFPDESAPRRYLARGDVYLTQAPPAAVGAAPRGERRAFARLEGELESLSTYPLRTPMPDR